MKTICFIMSLLILPVAAFDQREFENTDKTKSFLATLVDYNDSKEIVTVRFANRSTKSFPLSALSQECQDYVASKKEKLIIAKAISLELKEIEEAASGDARPTYYQVELRNSSDIIFESLDVRYTLYYRQGDLDKGGTTAQTASGSIDTGKVFGEYMVKLKTKSVDIVRSSRKAKGGWGPNVPGGRRVDSMTGVIVDLVVDGEIVRTVASNSVLLDREKENRSASMYE